MKDVVIVSAVRTPVGKFQGGLSEMSAVQLGAVVVREAVRRAGIDAASVDECVMGCVLPAGLGTESCAAGGVAGWACGYGVGDDDQHGVRLGIEGGCAGGAVV